MANLAERALSDTADVFEHKLGVPAVCAEFKELVANNQKPFVVRLLQAMPGYAVTIQVDREPT